MRHRHHKGKLTCTPTHQAAMGRNMAASLFDHGEVETTLHKAKAFRPFFERLITIARDGNRKKALGTPEGKAGFLHAVRHIASLLPHRPAVRRLFGAVAPAVGDRPGGYTRILRLDGRRLGDGSQKAIVMLVDKPAPPEPTAEQVAAAAAAAPKKGKGAGKGGKSPRKSASKAEAAAGAAAE